MAFLNTEEFRALLDEHETPCISLYQPTHRHHVDNRQDPIRFRNLLKEVESSLRRKYETSEVGTLLERFRSLAEDSEFWNHTLDGLAVFASPGSFRFYTLQRSVPELSVVAESFHTKPLVRMLQSADRYQILGLNRHEAYLYEGNRDALDEVELADGVPRTIEEALGEELTESHLTVASYGSAGGRGGRHASPSMHHGHGGKKDEVDLDNERFFRAVDRAVLDRHSRSSGLPLMLAALPQHHDLFRKVSHNPMLMAGGIAFDPKSIPADRLREEACRMVEPRYLERISRMASDFQEARSKFLGSADLSDIAQALVTGRVQTLLVESDRQIPGKVDPSSGRVEFGDLADPEVDDLLDDLAELAIRRGSEVVVVPADRMPTDSGAAATFRF
ncbi:hypothetical protein TA3x_003282 [Tundrisphaera sp. TA3]|uniref:baeRF3 domain-containing protein n=1 Tax=Tundrisphaera sp. TA3 TaxID=3435775 RepID=UPI003EB87510